MLQHMPYVQMSSAEMDKKGRNCLCRSRRPSMFPARLTTPRRSSSTLVRATSSRKLWLKEKNTVKGKLIC